MSFYIRGTISICINGNNSKIYITPCAGFLTPDKPSRAIAYPYPPPLHSENKIVDAKLIKLLDEKRLECDASGIEAYLPTLVAVAAQQKPVEIYLEIQDAVVPAKITGFVFPVPS